MKKIIASILSLIIGILTLTGCNKIEPNVMPAVADILTRIEHNVSIPQSTRIDDADTILTMYDLDSSMIEEMGMIKSGNGANADEIIVIKLSDTQYADAVREAFDLRLSVLEELFADYTPEDMPKIENAVTATSYHYIMLAVCEDPDTAVNAFETSFLEN